MLFRRMDYLEPFISFIIPVYNCIYYIDDCINSIFQSCCLLSVNAEIILIDDGSTDGSCVRCDQFETIYSGKGKKENEAAIKNFESDDNPNHIKILVAIDMLNESGYNENLRRVYTKDKRVFSHYAYNQHDGQYDIENLFILICFCKKH